MNNDLQYEDDLLMRYIDGEMNDAERSSFEKALQQDPELQSRYLRMTEAIEVIAQLGVTEKVKAIHEEMMTEGSSATSASRVISMKKITRFSLGIAAGIIVILVAITIFRPGTATKEQLFEQAFVDYQYSGDRNTGTTAAIQQHYSRSEFDAVVRAAENAKKITAEDSLFVALSYLKSGKPREAIGWLSKLNNEKLQPEVDFYLGLAFLANSEYSKALHQLRPIQADAQHIYHKQVSKEWIRRLERLNG